jgi:hypothetical protein
VSAEHWRQGAYQPGFMKLPFKIVWERFPTAIKIDPPQADSMFDAYSPPLEDWTFNVGRS